MKKQSGFTLIELLLVLAIIGIISAIAIPALLGQRARARDKSAVSNCDSVIADLVGQWDKGREAGSAPTAVATLMATYVSTGHANDKNPWNGVSAAYNAAGVATPTGTATTASGFAAACAAGSMGQVMLYLQTPASGGIPGFVGGAVKLNTAMNGSTTYRKITAIE